MIMRTLLLAVPVSLLLVAANAGAQSRDYPLTEDSSVSTVHVTAPLRGMYVTPEETNQVKGTYAMSNGWRLNVKAAPRGIFAKIDDQPAMRLIALSGDKYATADGNVEMTFNQGIFGDDMTMSYVPSSRLAERIEIRSSVAAR
jgi:hypothetical protein